MYPSANKWIEVHLEALQHNLHEVRRHLTPGCRLIAVLKADAYGLGAVELANQLAQEGVDYFAVSFLDEALELRESGRTESILIFSPLNPEEVYPALENSCTVTVTSLEGLKTVEEAARRLERPARIHLKVDTGLGRFGFAIDKIAEAAERAAESPHIVLEGIYTHFAEAGGSERFTRRQFKRFSDVLLALEQRGIRVPLRHCCNSAAFLRFPEMHLDAVRIGTLLGGQYPAGKVPRLLRLEDPYRFKARVVEVRMLKRGQSLGYFRTYKLRKESTVAVIPVGFVDGLGVEPAAKPTGLVDLIKTLAKILAAYFNIERTALTVRVKNKRAVIRGKVFMQFCMAVVPPDADIAPGDEVELPVRRTLASRGITRVYLREGRPGKVEESLVRVSYTCGEDE